LYAKSDQAYSSQNVAQINSFLDPSYVYVHPNGSQDSYADILRRQSWNLKVQSWSSPTQRNIRIKTTIKEVQVRNDGLVASVEWLESYESKDLSRPGWVPKLASGAQEETWKRTPAGWKRVLTKTSREDNSEPVPLSALIDHDTQLLEFLCGGSLTAEERRRFAAAITEQFREDPNLWYRNDVGVSKDLRSIRENPGAISAEVWMKGRLSYASATVEGSRILEAHDPIVVFDSNRPVLITEQTLRSLRDAATWVAQHTGRPKPDAQYIEKMRNTIRQQWRTWSDDTLSALSFSVKDFPATVEYMLGVLPEAKRVVTRLEPGLSSSGHGEMKLGASLKAPSTRPCSCPTFITCSNMKSFGKLSKSTVGALTGVCRGTYVAPSIQARLQLGVDHTVVRLSSSPGGPRNA
jgi:hypothetical protein